VALSFAHACASASGYDPSRYEGASPVTQGSADPETAALPQSKRPKMLDPRSPLDNVQAPPGVGDAGHR
jgi:hypothetical protein